MKMCNGCSQELLVSEFTSCKTRLDGLANRCRKCIKKYRQQWNLKNGDRKRENNRRWNRSEAGQRWLKEQHLREAAAPGYAEKRKVLSKKYALKNKHKIDARTLLKNAIYRREIKRPDICSKCFEKTGIHGHHEDYGKPLAVIWLCRECHGKRHQEINDLIRGGEDWTCRGFG